MKNFIILSALLTIALTGCAVQKDKTQFNGLGLTYNSDVTQDQNGNYVAAVEAAPDAGRKKGAEGAALKKAVDYCLAQNKNLNVVNKEISSHLGVNGVAKVTFKCV